MGFRIARREIDLRDIGESQVGAQDIDTGLPERVGRSVVGESSQGVDTAEADGSGFVAELRHGGGEALGVQAGGFAQSAVLVDALASVGDDQGDQGTRARDDAEGQFDEVEEGAGVEAGFGLEPASVEQTPGDRENRGRNQNGGGEGKNEGEADRPEAQTAPFGLALGQTKVHPCQDCPCLLLVAVLPVSLGSGELAFMLSTGRGEV
ncbi:hypothetical protein RB628_23200 [Streptomyces sp. ADMS]|nr:hypothetical protein [Streptomyces sp. ADMS]